MSRLIPEKVVNSWPRRDRDAYNAIVVRDAIRQADKTVARLRGESVVPDEERLKRILGL